MRNFFWLLKPYAKYGKVYIAVSLIFSCIVLPVDSLIQIYFPQAVLRLLSDGEPFFRIVLTAVGFEAVLLVITLFDDLYGNVISQSVESRITPKINRSIYEKSAKTRYSYTDDPDYYNNFSLAVRDYAGKSAEAARFLFSFLTTLITVFSMAAVLMSGSAWVIIIIAVSFLLKSFVVSRVNKNDVDKDAEMMPVNRKLDYCHRIFYVNTYAAELRTTKLKEAVLKNYDEAAQGRLSVIKKYIKKTFYLFVINDLLVRLAELLIVLGIANSIYSGRIAEAGAYITMIMASEKLNDIFYSLFDLFRTFNRLSVYGGKIRDFFGYENEVCGGERVDTDKPYEVAFRDVSFHYPNSDFCLKKLDFKINPGEKIAIVGENGAGKSTLVKLLLGLYDPTSGEILINGIPLRSYDITELRNTIGVAFQNTNIYALSLAENLRLYGEAENLSADAEKKFGIDAILRKNNASDDSIMTREFDENGIMVSGGEAQKIAIARLTMRKFGLLILDEPSSALDPIAEYELNRLLTQSTGDTTTVMVAHRLSSVRNMDKILVMSGGSLKEEGTHDELMALGGIYYGMFTKQAENYR